MSRSPSATAPSRKRSSARPVLLLLALCCSAPALAHPPASLFERLGGTSRISSIATALVQASAQDPLTARTWEGVNLQHSADNIALMICQVSGGPCVRDGDSMREVHGGMHITQQEYYHLVELLRAILINQGVGLRERNELLALLAPNKRDIVGQ